MRKKIEKIIIVHDHHAQKHQRKNQEISKEGRIALRGKLVVKHMH
jgi:hypothetical protein